MTGLCHVAADGDRFVARSAESMLMADSNVVSSWYGVESCGDLLCRDWTVIAGTSLELYETVY